MKKGFTILEMIIVLTIIALLLLITLPNIQQKKKIIDDTGCNALIEVINAQILLYEIDHLNTPSSISELISEGYIKESQQYCGNGKTIYIENGEAKAK